jgi:hypothetical protein
MNSPAASHNGLRRGLGSPSVFSFQGWVDWDTHPKGEMT